MHCMRSRKLGGTQLNATLPSLKVSQATVALQRNRAGTCQGSTPSTCQVILPPAGLVVPAGVNRLITYSLVACLAGCHMIRATGGAATLLLHNGMALIIRQQCLTTQQRQTTAMLNLMAGIPSA